MVRLCQAFDKGSMINHFPTVRQQMNDNLLNKLFSEKFDKAAWTHQWQVLFLVKLQAYHPENFAEYFRASSLQNICKPYFFHFAEAYEDPAKYLWWTFFAKNSGF